MSQWGGLEMGATELRSRTATPQGGERLARRPEWLPGGVAGEEGSVVGAIRVEALAPGKRDPEARLRVVAWGRERERAFLCALGGTGWAVRQVSPLQRGG